MAWGSSLYYTDDSESEILRQEFLPPDPRPIFEHPRLDPGYPEKEILYFQDQKYIQSVIDKKISSYIDFNYGYSDLTLSSVTPFYYAQNYTTTTTMTTTSLGGSTTESSATMTINETFAINSYGQSSLTFTQENQDSTQQYFMQINAINRIKNIGMGVEISYNNNPTITLVDPIYLINQTTTSTATTETSSISGKSSYPTSVVTEKEVPITLNTMTLKVVNVPVHLAFQWFPIYDGYFQPFIKAAIGCNFTHTDMQVTENNDLTRGSLTPLYQMGWAFKPFTYTYGVGAQLMLTPSLTLTCSYLKQKLDGRSTKFLVIINDKIDSSVNGTYGDMRFEFAQKTTLKEIGLAYYF